MSRATCFLNSGGLALNEFDDGRAGRPARAQALPSAPGIHMHHRIEARSRSAKIVEALVAPRFSPVCERDCSKTPHTPFSHLSFPSPSRPCAGAFWPTSPAVVTISKQSFFHPISFENTLAHCQRTTCIQHCSQLVAFVPLEHRGTTLSPFHPPITKHVT